MPPPPPRPTLFPYTTLFRSVLLSDSSLDGSWKLIRRSPRRRLATRYSRTGCSTLPDGNVARTACVAAVIGSSLSIRSEEHTSELQSRFDLVCRLLLEKKNGP